MLSRLVHIVLCGLAGLAGACGRLIAADASRPEVAAARWVERQLVQAAQQAAASFVFIGGGSGVVISPDGYVLSNHHVVEASKRWQVRIGGRSYRAEVVGSDPYGDISLLRVQGVSNLPHVVFADSDRLNVGEPVLALGNPFATAELAGEPAVTRGIISALHVFHGNYSDAIQTDAAVNPGNSGGPLLTMNGRLAGINGKIETRFQQRANTGIGLAVPANQIQRFLPLLKAAGGGLVYHGYLRGLVGVAAEDDTRQEGAAIKKVRPGSHAEKLGLKAGDRILYFNEFRLLNFHRFLGVMGTYPAGAQVQLLVERQGQRLSFKTTLDQLNPGTLGVQFRRPASATSPPVIDRVFPGLCGEKAGLKRGDTLLQINGELMLSLSDLVKYLAEQELMAGDTVKLLVSRPGRLDKEEIEVTMELSSVFDVPARQPGSERE
ncbi:MAG: trypsin-like peptidase domain-containing protein [Verrucomicrobiae bacterium]|nr:trypsin-like peptidase domain-containing protein [Verrucomicrobiae bacterium]